jgi:uncharacterized iron-regulated membrane protein
MKHYLPMVSLYACLTACAPSAPPPSIGYLPAGAFGPGDVQQDPQSAALGTAEAAFAHPGQLQGHPAQMALAIACLDAMGGQFSGAGRWIGTASTAPAQMAQARDEVRVMLGVPVAAPSQEVIDHLVAYAQSEQAGDHATALRDLTGPDFTKGPEQTASILANFPGNEDADAATFAAQDLLFPGGGDNGRD